MNQNNAIKQPWLSIIRVFWVALALYNLLPGMLGIPGYYQQLVALNPWPNQPGWTQATFSIAVNRIGLAPQVVAWIILAPALIEILVFISLGLVIFWRKSNEWQSLLVSFVLVGLCGTFTGDRFRSMVALPPVWQVVAHEAALLIWPAFFMFLILFPDGRFVPSWMRWVAVSLAFWYVLTEALSLILGQSPDWVFGIGFILLALILIGKVYRYRRLSSPVERQQIRWFLLAIMVFSVYSTLQFIFVRVFPISSQPGNLQLASYLIGVYTSDFAFLLLPIAIGIAIFRYHLWDIDLIIRRTLQYGLLTLLLGLVYFGMVVLLEQIFRAITGQNSPLAVVLSTLAIVVLFTPLRRRIQTIIDRRFFRQKYDAARALEEFSAAARREVELDHLTGQLADLVEQTVQPDGVWIWMRDKKRS